MKKIVTVFCFALLSLPFILSSCNHTNFNKQVAELDSLEQRLDSMEAVRASFNVQRVEEIDSLVGGQLTAIQNYFVVAGDTINRKTAIFLSQYSTINKALKRFKTNYSKVGKEIEFTRAQIKDLRKDLEANMLAMEDADKYCEEEKKVVADCKLAIEAMASGIEFAEEKFTLNQAKIDSIVATFPETVKR